MGWCGGGRRRSWRRKWSEVVREEGFEGKEMEGGRGREEEERGKEEQGAKAKKGAGGRGKEEQGGRRRRLFPEARGNFRAQC
eukprot:457149-Rhodomonas_salina.1